MSQEPDNLVLSLLREIRGAQGEHTSQLNALRQQVEDLSESVTYSLGLSAHANVRHESVQKRLEDLEARLKALEARIH